MKIIVRDFDPKQDLPKLGWYIDKLIEFCKHGGKIREKAINHLKLCCGLNPNITPNEHKFFIELVNENIK